MVQSCILVFLSRTCTLLCINYVLDFTLHAWNVGFMCVILNTRTCFFSVDNCKTLDIEVGGFHRVMVYLLW